MVVPFGTLRQIPDANSLQGQSGVKNQEVVPVQHSNTTFLGQAPAGKMLFFCFKNK